MRNAKKSGKRFIEQMGDLTSRDKAEVYVENWTEADWRYELEMAKAYALEDLEIDDPAPGVGV